LYNYEHKKLIEAITALDAVPSDAGAYAEWIKAEAHLAFLEENANSDEIVVHACGEYTFVHSLVVPNEHLSPPDEENHRTLQKIRDKINSHYINQEKELFRKRTGGKEWCNGQSLTDIVVFSKKPERQCVYQHSDNAVFVTQVLPSGFLVGGYGVSRLVFVYKNSANDANDLVDYSGVPHGFFEYSGPYSYMSLMGQRTIHSFRHISGNPLEGFLFYAAGRRH
jgi:hypothetical protein